MSKPIDLDAIRAAHGTENVGLLAALGYDNLTPIRARYEATTEGIWLDLSSSAGEIYIGACCAYRECHENPMAHPDVLRLVDDEEVVATMSAADAEFIAHAHQDIPALLAEVERLRAENAAAWTAGHRHPWRLGPDGCRCGAWSSSECGCGKYGTGELLSLADNPYAEADHA